MLGVGTVPRHWIRKIKTLQEKAIKTIKFLPNSAPVSKEMHKLRILKLKDFVKLQNILFVYDCLEEERIKSFNTTFKRMETDQFHNAISFNAHQLKRRDFKTEKYGCFSLLSKCLSDWNLPQNALKTNFKKVKRSETKALVTNHFLDNIPIYKVIVKINNYK